MALPLQAKILRLLQEQEFQRVGGREVVKTDVRVVAATHRDLPGLVAAGKFRADLFYRLAVCRIDLPPLRERGDDLPLLARQLVSRYSRELGRDIRDIAPATMTRLRGHAWPGNIRELQSALMQAVLRARGPVLLPAFLPTLESSRDQPDHAARDADLDLEDFIGPRLTPEMNDLYSELHREVDRVLFRRVLDYTEGNQRRAAGVLGIARQTMRTKLRDLALHGLGRGCANRGAP
jgi:DNA-binding NtrC family response regulator